MIPVICIGARHKFQPDPQIFLRALAHIHSWVVWLHWQVCPHAELTQWHPRDAEETSEPTCSLTELWGRPSLSLALMPTMAFGALGPFPWGPVPTTHINKWSAGPTAYSGRLAPSA